MSKAQERRAAYNSVIQDLYAKRVQLNQAIAALEALLHADSAEHAESLSLGLARDGFGKVSSANGGLANGHLAKDQPTKRHRAPPASDADESSGTLIDAIKSVLGRSERPLGNAEIFRQLKAAGVRFRSANPQLSVSQVLSRNSRLFGEPVRVGRGRWALR